MTTTQLTYWTPFLDAHGAFAGYECAVHRDGFKVLGTWTERDGYGVFIDHDNDAPFTVPQLQDLIATLREMMIQDGGNSASRAGCRNPATVIEPDRHEIATVASEVPQRPLWLFP